MKNCYYYESPAQLYRQRGWTKAHTKTFLTHVYDNFINDGEKYDAEILLLPTKYQDKFKATALLHKIITSLAYDFTINSEGQLIHLFCGEAHGHRIYLIKEIECEVSNTKHLYFLDDAFKYSGLTINIGDNQINLLHMMNAQREFNKDKSRTIKLAAFLNKSESEDYLLMQHLQDY